MSPSEDASLGNRGPDFFLDAEERTSFARQCHVIENLLQQKSEGGPFSDLELLLDEFTEQFLFPRHRFSANDIGSGDLGPIGRLNAGFVPDALGAQPKTQTCNLRGTRVNINSMDIVLDNETRHLEKERRFIREVGCESNERREDHCRLRRFVCTVRNLPCFVIDDSEEVEGI